VWAHNQSIRSETVSVLFATCIMGAFYCHLMSDASTQYSTPKLAYISQCRQVCSCPLLQCAVFVHPSSLFNIKTPHRPIGDYKFYHLPDLWIND
jgi:hypothetical protein